MMDGMTNQIQYSPTFSKRDYNKKYIFFPYFSTVGFCCLLMYIRCFLGSQLFFSEVGHFLG